MRKLILVLCLLLAVCGIAYAEPAEDAALAPMQAAYPGWEVLSSSQWGTAAAAALGQGEERVLCLTEKVDGDWQMVIANPTALRPGETPSIQMDTDTALFWSYDEGSVQYASQKENGVWQRPSQSYISKGFESCLVWNDEMLWYAYYNTDEDGNILSSNILGPAPAAWLGEYTLANYQYDLLSVNEYTGNWLNDEAMLRCAAEVTDWQVVSGATQDNGLLLLTRDDAGDLRLVVWAWPVTTVSSVLPEDACLGYENFTNWLWLPTQNVLVDFGTYADRSAHIRGIWPLDEQLHEEPLWLGKNWIAEDSAPFRWGKLCVGDHPWATLDVDWTTIPTSMEAALEHLDSSSWAVVNNPEHTDRLHLRAKADKDSSSYGKFYNGTPVEVLEKGKTWTKVRVAGQVGWMMTEYLAFGKDAWQVPNAFPTLFFREEKTVFPAWNAESVAASEIAPGGDWTVEQSETFVIIGVVEDEWYHIWFPDNDTYAYMRQSDFWTGNG